MTTSVTTFESPRCTKDSLRLRTSVNDCACTNGVPSSDSYHFFKNSFNNAFRITYVEYGRVLVTDKLERAWKEVAMIGLCPRHLCEGTEENHEELRSRHVVWLEFTDNSEERTVCVFRVEKYV